MPRNAHTYRQAAVPRDPQSMPFVKVAPGGRYFMTEDGKPFLVIGHNEAMPWPHMHNLRDEQDLAATESYLRMLAEQGVTVLRIMLEYCQDERWYFERTPGRPVPRAVLYWDNLIGLCERYGLRLLVVFFDTFFMSRRWRHHPYAKVGGLESPASMLTDPRAIEYARSRIGFFIDRWGDSPAIFAYDLFNEIHTFWGGTTDTLYRWIAEMARFVKDREMERWGKRHLLTVSVFGARPADDYIDLVLRHPELDFATTHMYEFGVVDNPENTIDGALVMRDTVRFAYDNMTDTRPYTDSESGPIYAFMDLRRQLPEPFDDEYHHNMSWAHLASGGAGSGMRWPFRRPHTLTAGMHANLRAIANFRDSVDWVHFSPRLIDDRLALAHRDDEPGAPLPLYAFGCSDDRQALVWLLRDLRAVDAAEPLPPVDLLVPGLVPGEYVAEMWDTRAGACKGEVRFGVPAKQAAWGESSGASWACESYSRLPLPPIGHDLAVAIKPLTGS